MPLMPVAGASSPIAVAGALAQTDAEYLGTVVPRRPSGRVTPDVLLRPGGGRHADRQALFGAPEVGLLVAAISQVGTELTGCRSRA